MDSPHNVYNSTASSPSASPKVSPVNTINDVMYRQPSMLELDAERRSFGSRLEIMEPRPLVYCGGLEERMQSSRL